MKEKENGKMFECRKCHALFSEAEMLNNHLMSDKHSGKSFIFFTVRNSSCGKVMFSQASVSHSVHGGVSASVHAWIHHHPHFEADTPPLLLGRHPPPPWQTSPWEDTREFLFSNLILTLVYCASVRGPSRDMFK